MSARNASELSLNSAQLMSLGGDDRITLDERSGLNSYGCAPEPMRSLGYSSSTASFISAAAYSHANSVHEQIRQRLADDSGPALYEKYLRRAAERLRHCYGLSAEVDVAFGPSGTDLEYVALACAMEAQLKVCNLVVEVDEVGSGCEHSQAGRYFAPRTALGHPATKGDPLPGFDQNCLRVETISMRESDGSVVDPHDHADRLEAAIAIAIARDERPLLHVVHLSLIHI